MKSLFSITLFLVCQGFLLAQNAVPACASGKRDYVAPTAFNDPNRGYFEDMELALKSPEKVRHLNLQSQKLKELPANIYLFTNLEILDAANNEITVFPPELGRIVSLKELYLNNNRITELPASIAQNMMLEKFYLTGNPLKKISPAIGELRQLKNLWLSSTDKNVVFQPAIWKLEQLEMLKLMGMNIPSLPENIQKFTGLTELCVSDNQIQEIPDGVFKLFRLQYLSFGKNKISYLPNGVGTLNQLNYLGIFGNPISNVPENLEQLQKLDWLAAWDTQLDKKSQDIIIKKLPMAKIAFSDEGVH